MRNIVNDYHIGYPDLDEIGAAFLSVLVFDETIRKYQVYSGIVKLPNPIDEGYRTERRIKNGAVASWGNKETYERAVTMFPALRREEYNG